MVIIKEVSKNRPVSEKEIKTPTERMISETQLFTGEEVDEIL